ncbi:MAG: SoxR reducing system RseC family protein [Planctomycetes bacterium]|nr:SoxR reducing system RseC family protein [Planctomycetota bacterium]
MVREAIVQSSDSGVVVVTVMAFCDKSGCSSCGACSGKPADTGNFDLQIKTETEYAPGTRVEVYLDMPNEAVLALIVFGIPLLLTIAAAVAGANMSADSGAGMVIGGIGGFIFGFAVVGLCSRFFKGLRPSGTIVRAVNP